MQNFFRLMACVLVLSMLSSCEKEVHIQLTQNKKQVVIEGSIETNQQPYVYLTNSIGFFDQIDLNSVNYIHNAVITVEDLNTSKSVQLKEYNIDTVVGAHTFSFHLYGPDVSDPVAMSFKGIVDHTYKLTVVSDGVLYESTTRIPTGNGLDSLWTEPVPGREDSFSTLRAIYSDPDTFGNSVHIKTLVHSIHKSGDPEIYHSSFTPVYNDDIINGLRIPITINIGFDASKNYSRDELRTLGFLHKGDTVTVKWSAIDKKTYTFWESVSTSQGSIGNPFSSPIKIQGNIPGALGVWAGYNAMFYTLIDSIK